MGPVHIALRIMAVLGLILVHAERKEESTVTLSVSGASEGENAYTRITTDFGRRLRFVASPPDSTSGWTWYTGTQDTASTQGGLQTFAGPSRNKGVQAGYTAGLAGNLGNATILGDFLNAVAVQDITAPLGLAAGGQAGLVAANMPFGVEVAAAGVPINISWVQAYQDIFKPVVQYGRRMLSSPLQNKRLRAAQNSGKNLEESAGWQLAEPMHIGEMPIAARHAYMYENMYMYETIYVSLYTQKDT
eukprot:jgi/Botrbrau1/18370/Bobra.0179s0088.1